MALTNFNVVLEDNYTSMNYTNGAKTIGDIYTVGTNAQRVDAAIAEFPWWIGYCSCDSTRCGLGVPDRVPNPGAPAWTDAEILQCTIAVAAHNDAIWYTGGAIGSVWYFGAPPLSRANIIWPHGSYYINYPLIAHYGHIEGQGDGNYSPDLATVVTVAGTTATRGYYYLGALVNSRPSYTKAGGYVISWSGAAWQIKNGATIYYSSSDNVAYPDLVTTWTAVTGIGPVPVVEFGLDLSQVCGGTRLSLYHEKWLDIQGGDNGPVKDIVQSLNWPCAVGGTLYAGVLGATGGGAITVMNNYLEGFQISDMKLEGRKAAAPEAVNSGNDYVTSYEDGGIAILRMGSGSKISDITGYNFNNATYVLGSGVPSNNFNLHSFDCNYAGAWLRGDGTFGFFGFECDECPTVFRAEGFVDPTDPSSYLITPGCTLTASNVKVETGTSGVSSRYKGTSLFYGTGWCVCDFNGVGYASSNIFPQGFCWVDPFPTGFTSTNSRISLRGLKVFGYIDALMQHSPTTGQAKMWFIDGNPATTKYNMTTQGFDYNSADGGSFMLIGGQGASSFPVPFTNRLDFVNSLAGTPWNYTAGTPAYPNGW